MVRKSSSKRNKELCFSLRNCCNQYVHSKYNQYVRFMPVVVKVFFGSNLHFGPNIASIAREEKLLDVAKQGSRLKATIGVKE